MENAETKKTEIALQGAKKVRAVRWDAKWVAIVDLADGRRGWGQDETLMRAMELAIEDASFEPVPTIHYDMRSAYPQSLTAAVVADDIAHGAAPALATNQTVRELMAAESRRIDENELDDFNRDLGRTSAPAASACRNYQRMDQEDTSCYVCGGTPSQHGGGE